MLFYFKFKKIKWIKLFNFKSDNTKKNWIIVNLTENDCVIFGVLQEKMNTDSCYQLQKILAKLELLVHTPLCNLYNSLVKSLYYDIK